MGNSIGHAIGHALGKTVAPLAFWAQSGGTPNTATGLEYSSEMVALEGKESSLHASAVALASQLLKDLKDMQNVDDLLEEILMRVESVFASSIYTLLVKYVLKDLIDPNKVDVQYTQISESTLQQIQEELDDLQQRAQDDAQYQQVYDMVSDMFRRFKIIVRYTRTGGGGVNEFLSETTEVEDMITQIKSKVTMYQNKIKVVQNNYDRASELVADSSKASISGESTQDFQSRLNDESTTLENIRDAADAGDFRVRRLEATPLHMESRVNRKVVDSDRRSRSAIPETSCQVVKYAGTLSYNLYTVSL
jgi:hypothetical protein